ncbi:ABC transporter permease [Comamonas composti]|uniref:ABC transporter permease n=1 Tax=Comamonas composti TaxID=408558 RepID=UPI001B7FA540|nr:ABC transporter permease [Comamonas composti]
MNTQAMTAADSNRQLPTSTLGGLLRHESVLALLLLAALAILSSRSEHFFTLDNLLNQGRLMTEVSLIALAMTFVIVTGGIDLSVGSIFGLAAVCMGVLWQSAQLPLPVAIVLAVVIGMLAGLFNGLLITRFSVPPLIATLATLMLYRGIAEGVSQGRSVRGYPDWFLNFAEAELLGIPCQLLLLGICAIVAAVVLGFTSFGRATYAVGANKTAAHFSGIHVQRTQLWIYASSGTLAAAAAMLFVTRVSTTRSDMGAGLELDAITAVVLGGSSIFGGRGTIVGTLLGLMLMQALKNGLVLAGVKGDGTIIVIGVVLIATILMSNLFNRSHERG